MVSKRRLPLHLQRFQQLQVLYYHNPNDYEGDR